jgi:hypothetical protein
VLPDEAAVAVAHDLFADDETLKHTTIRSYRGLVADIANNAEYVKCAVVVIDTNFGRAPTAAVVAAAQLLVFWAQERAIGTAVAVSSERDMLWSDDDIKDKLGTRVVRVALRPQAKYERLAMTVADVQADLARAVEQAVGHSRNSPETKASNLAFVACLAPAALARNIRLSPKIGDTPVKTLVVTAQTLGDLTAQVRDLEQGNSRTNVVLFVDPALRFLPPLPRLAHVVLPCRWRVEWWTAQIESIAELERPSDVKLAALAAGLGQGAYNDEVMVIYVRDSRDGWLSEDTLLPPAWGRHAAETMLCLARITNGGRTLASLGVAFPGHEYRNYGVLFGLERMGLVKKVAKHGLVSQRCHFRVVSTPLPGVAADLLLSGFTSDLGESLLIAHMKRQTSPGARFTLGVLASVFHVGPVGILRCRGVIEPPLQKIKEACHPCWERLMDKGRLWILVGILTASNVDFGLANGDRAKVFQVPQNLNFMISRAEFEAVGRRFKEIYHHLGQPCVASPPTEADVRAVETILVKAFLGSLCACEHGKVTEIGDLRTGVPIRYTDTCRWGEGLTAQQGRALGVYHALQRAGDTFSTDWLTLVDSESVAAVMRELFPGTPPEEWQDRLWWPHPV